MQTLFNSEPLRILVHFQTKRNFLAYCWSTGVVKRHQSNPRNYGRGQWRRCVRSALLSCQCVRIFPKEIVIIHNNCTSLYLFLLIHMYLIFTILVMQCAEQALFTTQYYNKHKKDSVYNTTLQWKKTINFVYLLIIKRFHKIVDVLSVLVIEELVSNLYYA